MAFDGLFTRGIVHELSGKLSGGRINKIHQPYKNEVVLIIRAKGENFKLLLSAHPAYARVQLTEEQYENPSEAPMFCMFLRKHLEGAIIENIRQIGLDRIVVFEIKGKDEIGDVTHKSLYVEIMGRHSNIVLVDEKNQLILDSIKHIPPSMNSYRSVLPGHEYILPPEQNKLNPLEATEEDVLRAIDFNSGKLDRQLVENFQGLSPLFAKEIVFQAKLANRVTLPKTFCSVMKKVAEHDYDFAITYGENKEAFYLFPLEHLNGEYRFFESPSALLDRYFFGKAERDRVKQRAQDVERLIRKEKEKNEKKIKKLLETLEQAKNAEKYKRFGELLTSYMFQLKKGMEEIELVDFYDENGGTVVIPLDPQKSPSENAQYYFTKYDKAKTALIAAKEQIEKAKEEVAYFETLLQQVETASPKDIEEIREELIEEGYLRQRQQKKQKKQKNMKPQIERYRASDGTEILVGKNNKQNEYLTNKLARRDEIWMHTKDIPGSHVVIRSSDPSEQTLLEGAILAAYFSKARNSSSVPVDYTKIRHVKKPHGAKPGFVIYENQQTIYVTPTEEAILKLKG